MSWRIFFSRQSVDPKYIIQRYHRRLCQAKNIEWQQHQVNVNPRKSQSQYSSRFFLFLINHYKSNITQKDVPSMWARKSKTEAQTFSVYAFFPLQSFQHHGIYMSHADLLTTIIPFSCSALFTHFSYSRAALTCVVHISFKSLNTEMGTRFHSHSLSKSHLLSQLQIWLLPGSFSLPKSSLHPTDKDKLV